jgi:DNA-binding CsgD family transcriptional regulator
MEAHAAQARLTRRSGTGGKPPGRRLAVLLLAIALQAVCALFFLADVVFDMIADGEAGNSLPHNAVELAAAVGLALGVVFLVHELRKLLARQAHMAGQIKVASGAFHDLLEARFEDWGLTPSERDVALLLVKGLSIAEIAGLRGSAEGTVKAHCNKIYAKAKVTGRAELVSLFIEDLMSDRLLPG